MLSRLTPLIVSLVLVACAQPASTLPSAHRDPLDAYASAVEESVSRYEIEAELAARSNRPLAPGRYEALLRSALASRGLTLDELRALARSQPRFYFTQQALYALRLDGADARASTDRRITQAR